MKIETVRRLAPAYTAPFKSMNTPKPYESRTLVRISSWPSNASSVRQCRKDLLESVHQQKNKIKSRWVPSPETASVLHSSLLSMQIILFAISVFLLCVDCSFFEWIENTYEGNSSMRLYYWGEGGGVTIFRIFSNNYYNRICHVNNFQTWRS